MSDPKIKKSILTFLKKEYPKDFSIQEIADRTNMHRNTISIYLKVLRAEETVVVSRVIGNNTMYSISQNNEEN
jgi:DNA-binding IclR family transcriptional regulator